MSIVGVSLLPVVVAFTSTQSVWSTPVNEMPDRTTSVAEELDKLTTRLLVPVTGAVFLAVYVLAISFGVVMALATSVIAEPAYVNPVATVAVSKI